MPGSTTVVNPPGATASAGAPNGIPLGPGKRQFPHIDDIVNVTTETKPHTPIDTLLQKAEIFLRQAETAKTFGRLDFALSDYIRTNLVMQEMQRSKGWVSLIHDNKGYFDRHNRLLRKVQSLDAEYKQIKDVIKQNNAETGVKPKVDRANTGGGGHAGLNGTTATRPNGAPPEPGASLTPRTKPAVHPKPQALQSKPLDALEERFAKLRTGASARPAQATQDPRIRTQLIIQTNISKPLGSMDLPRPPDAIYNPPRGTISKEAAELPSSAPRTMFTRTNSSAGVSSLVKTVKAVSSPDSYSPSQSFSDEDGASQGSPKRAKPNPPIPQIPEGDSLSVAELVRFMQSGVKNIRMLIIDIRSRALFDEGHIDSHATICVDPDILSRKDVSAQDIEDSMVLGPSSEQILFEKRHEFDLVVFYDQSSIDIPPPWKTTTTENKAIRGLYDALSKYDFPGPSRQKVQPKLLRGGLDAWMGLVGRGGLRTSSTLGAPSARHPSLTPFVQSLAGARRPIPVAAGKPFAAEDPIKPGMKPVRTTEDFLRRRQDVAARESMSSPTFGPQTQAAFPSFAVPPTRPPPTLPRRSHSGLADTAADEPVLARMAIQRGVGRPRAMRVGIDNPGVHCFANSAFQALFATPGFGREIATGEWERHYKNPPMRKDEKYPNPQELTRCIHRVFARLHAGTLPSIDTRDAMAIIRDAHSKTDKNKPQQELFGGPAQQDSHEFCVFLLASLHDETNMLRNRMDRLAYGGEVQTGQKDAMLQGAISYWKKYRESSDSIVDKYFRSIEIWSTRCLNTACNYQRYQTQLVDVYSLAFPQTNQSSFDIHDLLAHEFRETKADLQCEKCKVGQKSSRKQFIGRFPDRLILSLSRFEHHQSPKINTRVSFPIRDLDLTRYSLPGTTNPPDPHFSGQMLYDCYAVVCHIGSRLSEGHYISYVQDDQSRDPTDWYRLNDSMATKIKVGSAAPGDETEKLYRDGNSQAYILFYKLRGSTV